MLGVVCAWYLLENWIGDDSYTKSDRLTRERGTNHPRALSDALPGTS